MDRADRRRAKKQALRGQLELPIGVLVREALLETVVVAGLASVQALLEREREALCGPRYRHDRRRRALRGGHLESSLVLGGRRVGVKRPRVRSAGGGELGLPSWRLWSARDPLDQRTLEQMILGVSTRHYARSLEPLPAPLRVRGVRRSAVSRRFVTHTEHKLAQLLSQSLAALDLPVLMIDGVHFGTHVVLVALGITAQGDKRVWGLWEGATENAAACKALLADLAERGLKTDRTLLVVIDGSKALARAVRDTLGRRALIQRCREHKKRNVTDALPEKLRLLVRQAMNQAYATPDAQRARRLLENLARKLGRDYPGAAAALGEGLQETLTVTRLGLPEQLARALATTNPIENLFSRVRAIARRVSHWQGGNMVLRWAAAALTECQPSFHRIYGWKAMPVLIAALRKCDTAPTTIDPNEAAA